MLDKISHLVRVCCCYVMQCRFETDLNKPHDPMSVETTNQNTPPKPHPKAPPTETSQRSGPDLSEIGTNLSEAGTQPLRGTDKPLRGMRKPLRGLCQVGGPQICCKNACV